MTPRQRARLAARARIRARTYRAVASDKRGDAACYRAAGDAAQAAEKRASAERWERAARRCDRIAAALEPPEPDTGRFCGVAR